MRTLPLRRLDSATSALATRHLWRLRLRGIGIALPQYFPLEPHLTLLLIYIFFQNSNLLWSIKYDSDKLLQKYYDRLSVRVYNDLALAHVLRG